MHVLHDPLTATPALQVSALHESLRATKGGGVKVMRFAAVSVRVMCQGIVRMQMHYFLLFDSHSIHHAPRRVTDAPVPQSWSRACKLPFGWGEK